MKQNDFENIILPLKDKIYRFARRFMSFQTVAEDITQEVFIKLWTKKEELDKYRNVEAFAMTITRNLCLDHLKSPRNNTSELQDIHEPIVDQTPLDYAENQNDMQLMHQIMDRLPEQQKTLIQLRDIEGYEYDEIEKITGIKTGTIRVSLSRARQKMKEELTKVYNYGIGSH